MPYPVASAFDPKFHKTAGTNSGARGLREPGRLETPRFRGCCGNRRPFACPVTRVAPRHAPAFRRGQREHGGHVVGHGSRRYLIDRKQEGARERSPAEENDHQGADRHRQREVQAFNHSATASRVSRRRASGPEFAPSMSRCGRFSPPAWTSFMRYSWRRGLVACGFSSATGGRASREPTASTRSPSSGSPKRPTGYSESVSSRRSRAFAYACRRHRCPTSGSPFAWLKPSSTWRRRTVPWSGLRSR